MRNTLLILLISVFQAFASNSFSQTNKLNLEMKNVTIREVLSRIEEESGIYFLYNGELIDVNRKVNISSQNESIDQILSRLFGENEVNATVKDRHIVLTPVVGQNRINQQQPVTIGGQVFDASGVPMPGVTIVVKGTTTGTITDFNGSYMLSNVPGNAVLLFSFVGMRTKEIPVAGRTTVNVELEEETIGIEEVVAIGYGTMKKSDLTGSVVSVSADALNKFPTANVTEMLRGQAPGVQVSLADPSPGGSSTVRIRGNRSLSSSQNPLYLVDGMIVPHINDLNSSDIESIEILKDASSQAIYGSRASNGVILISTKRGAAGKISVDVNSYAGFQEFKKNFSLYSPDEWLELRFWAKYNDGQAGIGTPDNINYEAVLDDAVMYEAYTNKRYVDWEKLMLGNALQHKHDVTVRGGTEKFRFSTGFGYYNQDGVVEKSGYERGTFRLNTDVVITDWMDLGSNISFTKSSKQTADGTFNQFITRPPLAQAYDPDGNLIRESTSAGDINPLWRIRNYDEEQQDEYLNLSSSVTIRPFKGFSYKLSANLRSNNRERGVYKTKLYPASTGEGLIRNFTRSSWLIDHVVNYELPIANKNHQLTVTLIQSSEADVQKNTGFDFLNSTTDIFKWNVAADSEISEVTRSIERVKAASFAGRLHYNLMNRYLLTASFRRDGASVFGKENKWANFPSAALAWRVSEEQFLSDADWLDNLKFRVSYGVVGNWAIPAYRTLGLSDSYEYLFGNGLAVGYLPTAQLQNLGLKWETTGSFNAGIDFSAYHGRLNASLEHYRTRTEDLLLQRTIPSITGYNTMWDNLGETKSWGWEATIDGRVIDQKDLVVSLGASFSTQKNEIVKIDGRVDEEGKPINDTNNRWFIGEPINVDYNFVFGGIWQEGETPGENDYLPGDAAPTPGNIKISDYNGDGSITTDDRKIYTLDPQWYGSFNMNVLFKGIDLALEFYTVQGVKKNNNYLYFFDSGGSLNGKLNGMKVNYWTPENQSNEAPRPQFTAAVPYFNLLGIQDASYFRLRTTTLGYTLPKSLSSQVFIEKVRFYMTGTNLFTSTKFKSYSPETTPGVYPEARTFTFGANLTF